MSYVDERFVLDEIQKRILRRMKPQFGYNGFGEITYYRSYSRMILDSVGTLIGQEHWADTIIRVIEGLFSIRKDWYIKTRIEWDEKKWQVLAINMAQSLFRLEWLPPGRGLWCMGTDLIYDRGAMALYNCAYTDIGYNWIDDLVFLMDTLMYGVGVGFGPIYTDLKLYEPDSSYSFEIPDSREGWVESVKLLLEAFQEGSPIPIFDYSEIRLEGALISSFGGLASGPGPLKDLHEKIKELSYEFINGDYDEIEYKTDLANLIGVCVVTGNVRRSAEIALGQFDDDIFWDLKNPIKKPNRVGHSWMSNNSVILSKDEHFENINQIAEANISGYDIGYLNLRNFPKGRIGKDDNLREDKAKGLNPCICRWSYLLTVNGLRKLEDLNVGDKIWSEVGWTKIVKKWSTGIQEVYKYITKAGSFYGTENHQVISDGLKVEVKYADVLDILVGEISNKINYSIQTIVDGLVIGDGSKNNLIPVLYIGESDFDYFNSEIKDFIGDFCRGTEHYIKTNIKIEELNPLPERIIPKRYLEANTDIKCSFLRGLFTANGSIFENKVSLSSSCFRLIEQVQLMLSSIGISSTWCKRKARKEKVNEKIANFKENYQLFIFKDRKKFYDLIGFIQKYKTNNLLESIKRIDDNRWHHSKSYEVIEQKFISQEEVFDITVDNSTHTFWCFGLNISNCGEIPLESREVCNVGETLPTRCVDTDRWLQACEYTTFYCSTVALLPTHQPSTNRIVARNRRIGVSIIDVSGWTHQIGVSKVTAALRVGYQRVRKINKELADEAGIPESIRVTTIKPGGTVPKIAGRTAGAGHPTFHYTIRRIRVQANTALERLLINAGIPSEPDAYSKQTTVFEYPIVQGPAKPATEVSVWESAMNVVLLQREWADNAVSNTLYFKPRWILISSLGVVRDEKVYFDLGNHEEIVVPIGHVTPFEINNEKYQLKDNKLYRYNPKHEENELEAVLAAIAPVTKSVSLLPHTETGIFKQMPEEGITKEEYERRISQIKQIDWSKFVGSDGEDERYCQGDKCLIT